MSDNNNAGVPVTKQERNITDGVMARISAFQSNGELVLPKNYSPENALKSAYLILVDMKDKDNRPVLESCTKESIANALLKMVTDGLSVAKRQGSFIAYGGKLSWQREYAGNIALARRVSKLDRIKGNVIFEGDVFEYEIDAETGRRKLIKHAQTLESVGGMKIKGAYALYSMEDGTMDMELMTLTQIQNAWNQGHAKGGSPAHKNFPDQMAIKTVINRACKLLINTSDDAHLFEESAEDVHAEVINTAVSERANRIEITMEEPASTMDVTPEPAKDKNPI